MALRFAGLWLRHADWGNVVFDRPDLFRDGRRDRFVPCREHDSHHHYDRRKHPKPPRFQSPFILLWAVTKWWPQGRLLPIRDSLLDWWARLCRRL